MSSADIGAWGGNWAWSLPIIVLDALIHVTGLALINETLGRPGAEVVLHRRILKFVLVMAIVTVVVTILHGIEAFIWASAYRLLDSFPDYKTAMLYSLSAMTSYGHANVFLDPHWQMMGALESLNGMLLLGLTTAFLFSFLQKLSRQVEMLPEYGSR